MSISLLGWQLQTSLKSGILFCLILNYIFHWKIVIWNSLEAKPSPAGTKVFQIRVTSNEVRIWFHKQNTYFIFTSTPNSHMKYLKNCEIQLICKSVCQMVSWGTTFHQSRALVVFWYFCMSCHYFQNIPNKNF